MSTTITDPFLGLFLLALFFYVLFWVVRAAVTAGVRTALRADLLEPERRRTVVPDTGDGGSA